MSATDYLINAILVLLVLRQIRESRLGVVSLVLPVLLVGAAAAYYLRSIPTAGNDLALDLTLAAIGAILGVACGLTTRLRRDTADMVLVRAGVAAAILWIVGVGCRMAFALYSTHGGGPAIARFSIAHDITSSQAWVAALILMALAEVIARLVTIRVRAHQVPHIPVSQPAPAVAGS